MGKRQNKSRDKRNDKEVQWSLNDRMELVSFLVAYREAALSHYRHDQMPILPAFSVGGTEFPTLDTEAVKKSHLALPSTLTPKQRKVVHECCIETFLYHGTVEDAGRTRQVLISIYADGLPPHCRRHGPKRGLYMFRPWFCRQRQDTELTETAVEQIEHFVDQPSECIRDDDLLDLAKLDNLPTDFSRAREFTLVDTPKALEQMRKDMERSPLSYIAFDVEAYNESKFSQLTCLVQLAVAAVNQEIPTYYVLDPLASGVWDEVHGALASFFADPSIIKIGHSIGGLDVPSLHRDFGIVVVNAFDTYEAADQLGLAVKGLVDICHYYNLIDENHEYKSLKGTYQQCDWTARPLSAEMMQYGVYDVSFLMILRELMMRDLTREIWEGGSDESARVAAALAQTLRQFEQEDELGYFDAEGLTPANVAMPTENVDCEVRESKGPEERKVLVLEASDLRLQIDLVRTLALSQERCKQLWKGREEPSLKPLDAMIHRLHRSRIRWTRHQNDLYTELVDWRCRVADGLGTLPPFVVSLDFLVAVAYQRPVTESSLRRISQHLPFALEENEELLLELVSIVRKAAKLDGFEEDDEENTQFPECYFHRRNRVWYRIQSDSTVSHKLVLGVSCIVAGVAVIAMIVRRSR